MGCVTATAAAAAAAVGAIGGEAARKGDERAAVESHPLEEGRHKRRGVLRHHHEVVASRVAQRCVAGRVDGSLEGEANSRGAVRVVWCQLALLGDLCEHPLAVPLEGEHERRLREVPLFLGRHHRHLRDGEGWPARSRPHPARCESLMPAAAASAGHSLAVHATKSSSGAFFESAVWRSSSLWPPIFSRDSSSSVGIAWKVSAQSEWPQPSTAKRASTGLSCLSIAAPQKLTKSPALAGGQPL
mmetsp:Transcript_24314/g.79229  ORF Transcript_24314/g.79229 Transcript_24314/m.79229 type:complete len:243 (-) Transcript_24314:1891-2619(-)